MKSSSGLFPVELVSAEHRDSYYEDLYSLKPNNSADKSVEIALLHLHAEQHKTRRDAMLFIHDAFHSHWQWMDNGVNQQAIMELLTGAYDIWLMDWRAHGSSKKNLMSANNTIAEMAQYDLTAVLAFMREQGSTQLTLVGQGYGAQMALWNMALLPEVQRYFFFDGYSIAPQRRFYIPLVKALAMLKLVSKTHIAGAGSEPEPVGFFYHQFRQQGLPVIWQRKAMQERKQAVVAQAEKITWLCSRRTFETWAKRLLGPRANLVGVKKDTFMPRLLELVAS